MPLSPNAQAIIEELARRYPTDDDWTSKDIHALAVELRTRDVNRLALNDMKEVLRYLAKADGTLRPIRR